MNNLNGLLNQNVHFKFKSMSEYSLGLFLVLPGRE